LGRERQRKIKQGREKKKKASNRESRSPCKKMEKFLEGIFHRRMGEDLPLQKRQIPPTSDEITMGVTFKGFGKDGGQLQGIILCLDWQEC